ALLEEAVKKGENTPLSVSFSGALLDAYAKAGKTAEAMALIEKSSTTARKNLPADYEPMTLLDVLRRGRLVIPEYHREPHQVPAEIERISMGSTERLARSMSSVNALLSVE
ncbi:MAG: hypothetical protein IH820_17100, partial [Bacteroidetes bacterium]|nr:hypothetical protein [Bacteroidota bacterium]